MKFDKTGCYKVWGEFKFDVKSIAIHLLKRSNKKEKGDFL